MYNIRTISFMIYTYMKNDIYIYIIIIIIIIIIFIIISIINNNKIITMYYIWLGITDNS